jgi:hypothetical protein
MRIACKWIRSASFWSGFRSQVVRHEDGRFRCLWVALGRLQVILVTALMLLFAGQLASAQGAVEHDVAVVSMGNITTASLGEENRTSNPSVIWQGNAGAAGVGVYSENWRHNNGLILGGSFTKTDSKLFDETRQVLFDYWSLDRYTLDAIYEHRFRAAKTFEPYLGLGGFLAVLWGGVAPAHSNVNHTGLDAWGGLVAPAGMSMRVSPRVALRAGLLVDVGKASTYGDIHYTASQNLMFEPQFGVVCRLGKLPVERIKFPRAVPGGQVGAK